MERAMSDDWQSQADALVAKRRAVWAWTPVLAFVAAVILVAGAFAHGPLRWGCFTVGGAVGLWTLIYGTAVYMRRVDEQERDANLWGCYIGMCVYLALFAIHALMDQFGAGIVHADYYIFGIVMVTVMGVFSWRRFH